LAGLKGWFAFSSIPVPSSYRSIENVLLDPQHSNPNSGTLIHLIRKSLTAANPSACTGNVFRAPPVPEPGFRSVHAAAIFGRPDLNAGTFAMFEMSPPPNVMFPFEFRKNPFHTPCPAVPGLVTQSPPKPANTSPVGFANRNSNPPD